MKPDVTAVIPTRDRRDLLALTLRAVLGQRHVDLEVIVVDDGSSDGTADLVAAFADRRLRLIRHERAAGVSTARNHGAQEARASWLAFCDDDDLWAPDKLSRQLAAAAAGGCTWSYGGAVRVDSALAIMGGTPPPSPERLTQWLPRWNLMPGGSSNVIVRADAFREAGGWNPDFVNLADWDLWARLARHGPPACVPAPLVAYRIHPGNASAHTALILREARLLDGRHGARIDYGELHHYLAWVCLRSGRRREALRHLARAAADGQVRDVAHTVAGLARRYVARRVPALRPETPTAVPSWIAEADAWVSRFRSAST